MRKRKTDAPLWEFIKYFVRLQNITFYTYVYLQKVCTLLIFFLLYTSDGEMLTLK